MSHTRGKEFESLAVLLEAADPPYSENATSPGWTRDGDRWYLRLPCGHVAQLSAQHEVDEHADGTISVVRKPANSNSILCSCGWHGYVERGVFLSV